MNNIKKIGLTALAGSLVAGSAYAAEMSVSGSASLTFSGGDDKKVQGQGWTMGDSLTFTASGDVNDIGVSLSYELDGQGAAIDTVDDHSMTLDFGDAGTLQFSGHGGSSAMGSVDDVVPNAYEESWDVVSGADGAVINGHGGDNIFRYTYNHDSGVKAVVTYLNAADAVSDVSTTAYNVEYTGVDGLRVGYAQQDTEQTTGEQADEMTMYATYAMGGFTVGIQTSEKDRENGSTNDTESTSMGITYQVNDDMSVGYHTTSIEYNSGEDQESSGVSASYTMGSMKIGGAMNSVDNIANSSANDRRVYELNIAFNF